MIASSVRLQVSNYRKLSNYNWIELLVKNKTGNAPFIFEEIVMVIKIHSENGRMLLSSCNSCSTNKTRQSAFYFWTAKADVLHRYHFDELISTDWYIKHFLQNRITRSLFYGRSIQINNLRWTKLSV